MVLCCYHRPHPLLQLVPHNIIQPLCWLIHYSLRGSLYFVLNVHSKLFPNEHSPPRMLSNLTT